MLYRQEKKLLSSSAPYTLDTFIRIKAVIYITFVFHVGGAETGSLAFVTSPLPLLHAHPQTGRNKNESGWSFSPVSGMST